MSNVSQKYNRSEYKTHNVNNGNVRKKKKGEGKFLGNLNQWIK